MKRYIQARIEGGGILVGDPLEEYHLEHENLEGRCRENRDA